MRKSSGFKDFFWKNFAVNIVLVGITTCLTQIVLLVFNKILASSLDPDVYGVFILYIDYCVFSINNISWC